PNGHLREPNPEREVMVRAVAIVRDEMPGTTIEPDSQPLIEGPTLPDAADVRALAKVASFPPIEVGRVRIGRGELSWNAYLARPRNGGQLADAYRALEQVAE